MAKTSLNVKILECDKLHLTALKKKTYFSTYIRKSFTEKKMTPGFIPLIYWFEVLIGRLVKFDINLTAYFVGQFINDVSNVEGGRKGQKLVKFFCQAVKRIENNCHTA